MLRRCQSTGPVTALPSVAVLPGGRGRRVI
jgi:hypothetical protein